MGYEEKYKKTLIEIDKLKEEIEDIKRDIIIMKEEYLQLFLNIPTGE